MPSPRGRDDPSIAPMTKPSKKRGPPPERLVIAPEQIGQVLDGLLGTPKPAKSPAPKPKPKPAKKG